MDCSYNHGKKDGKVHRESYPPGLVGSTRTWVFISPKPDIGQNRCGSRGSMHTSASPTERMPSTPLHSYPIFPSIMVKYSLWNRWICLPGPVVAHREASVYKSLACTQARRTWSCFLSTLNKSKSQIRLCHSRVVKLGLTLSPWQNEWLALCSSVV